MTIAFNINSQTTPITSYDFGSDAQRAAAEDIAAERILYWDRDTYSLPQYVTRALAEAGYRAKQIGRTTYKSSTWALCRA